MQRSPGLLSPELIEACTSAYFMHLYPSIPVLDEEQITHTVARIWLSAEAYCLVAALSAFVLIHPGIKHKVIDAINGFSTTSSKFAFGLALLDDIQRIRKGYDYIEAPTITSVITSYFLFCCCSSLNKQNTAWFHLREATASIQILGFHDESVYHANNYSETSVERRAFWLFLIAER